MPGIQIVLSVLTLVASVTAAVLVWRANTTATRQREQAARREEWWRRFQWATDLALDASDPQRANVGVLIIRALLDSPLAGADELNAAGAVLDEVIGLGEDGNDEDEEGSGGGSGEGNAAGAGAQ